MRNCHQTHGGFRPNLRFSGFEDVSRFRSSGLETLAVLLKRQTYLGEFGIFFSGNEPVFWISAKSWWKIWKDYPKISYLLLNVSGWCSLWLHDWHGFFGQLTEGWCDAWPCVDLKVWFGSEEKPPPVWMTQRCSH